MTETQTPAHLIHDDARVSALLRLAEWSNDRSLDATFYGAQDIATQIVPDVDGEQSARMFVTISQDLEIAAWYEVEGADAVRETYGRWDDIVGLTADEKATELAVEHRDNARLNAEMLVTLHDNGGRRDPLAGPVASTLRILKQGGPS